MSVHFPYLKLLEVVREGDLNGLEEAFFYLTVEDIRDTKLCGKKTAIEIAIDDELIEVVEALLEKFEEKGQHASDAKTCDKTGVFVYACRQGNYEMAEYCLQHWPDYPFMTSSNNFCREAPNDYCNGDYLSTGVLLRGHFDILRLMFESPNYQIENEEVENNLQLLMNHSIMYRHSDFQLIGERYTTHPVFTEWVQDKEPLHRAVFMEDLAEVDRLIEIMDDEWLLGKPYQRNTRARYLGCHFPAIDVFQHASSIGDVSLLKQLLDRAQRFECDMSEIAERCCDAAACSARINVLEYLMEKRLVNIQYTNRWKTRLTTETSMFALRNFFLKMSIDDQRKAIEYVGNVNRDDVEFDELPNILNLSRMAMDDKYGLVDQLVHLVAYPEDVESLFEYVSAPELFLICNCSFDNNPLDRIGTASLEKVLNHLREACTKLPSTKLNKPSTKVDEASMMLNKLSAKFGDPSTMLADPSAMFGEPSMFAEASEMFGDPSALFAEVSEMFGEPSMMFDGSLLLFKTDVLHVLRQMPQYWEKVSQCSFAEDGPQSLLDYYPQYKAEPGKQCSHHDVNQISARDYGRNFSMAVMERVVRLLSGATVRWSLLRACFLRADQTEKDRILNRLFLFGVKVHGINIPDDDETYDCMKIPGEEVPSLKCLARRMIHVAARKSPAPMRNRDKILSLEKYMPRSLVKYILIDDN